MSTDNGLQTTVIGHAGSRRDVTPWRLKKTNTNHTKNETCQCVFIFIVTLTRLYLLDAMNRILTKLTADS